MKALIEKHGVEIISCGNGTASKESEIFIAELIKEIKQETGREVSYMIVNEAGASVYSASPLGAEEFPDYDVTTRSAVSIARRLQDPLAELIKIDPKSIGVGQYQHDMNEKRLDGALAGVLEDCVNSVGVDLNTASVSLLKFVAGLNAARQALDREGVIFPEITMIGAMAHYISHGGLGDFVPMNANFGIIPLLDHHVKGGKIARYEVYAARSLECIDRLVAEGVRD